VRFLCQVARKGIEILTGISLPPDCRIGEGLYIGHFGTIIISSMAVIGKNCNLSQGVTLGVSGRGERRGAPTVGNRVYIAANAVVAGKISIGDDAVIGACAVVTTSVPPRAVVAGNPAQIKSHRGSFGHIYYDGMEKDPERLASLALSDPQSTDSTGVTQPGSPMLMEDQD
jgi:serine O-acetyltransferase